MTSKCTFQVSEKLPENLLNSCVDAGRYIDDITIKRNGFFLTEFDWTFLQAGLNIHRNAINSSKAKNFSSTWSAPVEITRIYLNFYCSDIVHGAHGTITFHCNKRILLMWAIKMCGHCLKNWRQIRDSMSHSVTFYLARRSIVIGTQTYTDKVHTRLMKLCVSSPSHHIAIMRCLCVFFSSCLVAEQTDLEFKSRVYEALTTQFQPSVECMKRAFSAIRRFKIDSFVC